MTEAKKPRVMTPKGFLAKTTTRAANSAISFIAQYRAWLTTGELASVTSPIIAKMDAGKVLPTPALKEIQAAVLGHIIAIDVSKAEKSIEEADKPKVYKDWVATIYNSAGEVQTRVTEKGETEDLIQSFDEPARADGWVDRRLFDGASDWYGVVLHTKSKVRTIIDRGSSIARVLKQKKGPSVHARGLSTKTLGFGVKSKQTRVSFSRG